MVEILLQLVWSSIAASTYHVLFAIAFSLVLKVTKIWNFAQPGFMTIAFYVIFWGINKLGVQIYLAFPMALVVTVFVALALERYAFETLIRMKALGFTMFIFTFMFSEFSSYVITLLFGSEPYNIYPMVYSPMTFIGGIGISQWDVKSISATILVVATLYGILSWSKPGKTLIAVSNNERLAELYGISRYQAYALSMMLAAILCTIGMYFFGTKFNMTPHAPLAQLTILSVSATILGGIGNIFGAAIAALALNFLQAFSILIIPSNWQNLLLYFFFFIIIIIMPHGFLSFLTSAIKGRRK